MRVAPRATCRSWWTAHYPQPTEKLSCACGRCAVQVWTPVQAVNLYFVPLPFQPAVVAAVNVGWKTTLSILNHYQCAPPALFYCAPSHAPFWSSPPSLFLVSTDAGGR